MGNTADPSSSAWRDTTDQPPPQDSGAGDHGEPVPVGDEWDTRRACMKHDSANRFCSEDTLTESCFALITGMMDR